jgi:hypothetical protein
MRPATKLARAATEFGPGPVPAVEVSSPKKVMGTAELDPEKPSRKAASNSIRILM